MKREEEARRTLKRLTEPSEGAFHNPAPGASGDDRIEKLGKRIAGYLRVVLVIGIFIYLATLLSPGP